MKKKSALCIALFVFICILINYCGKSMAITLKLPLWLDSIGTIIVAYVLGPVCGAIVGAAVNISYSFFDSVSMAYAIVNVLTGIIAGLMAKRNYFTTVFRAMSVGAVLAIVSTAVSVPMNIVSAGGYTGNIWGDGVINLILESGFPKVVAYVIGEFYIDFIDKLILAVCLWFVLWVKRKIQHAVQVRKAARMMAFLAVFLTGSILSVMVDASRGADVYASDMYANYVRRVFDTDEGIMGGTATSVASTGDGVIWIGTYEGLYRFTGSEFRLMDDIKSIHNVNALYVDVKGRMWVGTNDSGLTILVGGEPMNVVDEENGLPANSVRSITEASNGDFYIGTSGAMAVISLSGGLSVTSVIDVNYVRSMDGDDNENIVAVNNEGSLFLIRGDQVIDEITPDEEMGIFTSCAFDSEGLVYAGTSGSSVYVYKTEQDKLVPVTKIECYGLSNINSINSSEDGGMYVCTDDGVGFISSLNIFRKVDTGNFNDSVDNMTVDYQGNMWFSSSRLGVMYMSASCFTDVFERAGVGECVVNSVTMWHDRLYAGTDNGLVIIEDNKAYTHNSLMEALDGVRIRCIRVSDDDHLWICTSGVGLWRVSANGDTEIFNTENGCSGNKFRTCIELEDGSIMAGGESGITVVSDNRVVSNIGYDEGLVNLRVLTLMQTKDGSVIAGTDGGGIAVIRGGKIEKTLRRAEGLSSDIVLRTVEDENGYYILMSNGIAYMDYRLGIRNLTNFPYYNNLDLLVGPDDNIFVLTGGGIYVVNRDALLAGGELDYILLDYRMGLPGTITANSWNYIDPQGMLYFSLDSGVCMLDTRNYMMENRSYRMMMGAVKLDGVDLKIEDGEDIFIPRGTERIDFSPEIINFTISDPYVSVYLEGYDNAPTVMSARDLGTISYTNLEPGEYRFHLAVLDVKKQRVIEERVYTVNKEMNIQDYWWFRIYFVSGMAIFLMWLSWFVTRMFIQRTLDYQRAEIDRVKDQVRMGNETIMAIARTVDAKDENTSQHSTRVSEYSVLIAQKLGYSYQECENLRKMALLHDIGKIGIPDSVLKKPGKLTEEEYAIMKSHVTRGVEILKDFTLVDNVADGVLYHHERYDGTGYMSGLKGEAIPLNGRIICIADAFDAMTANRIYRKKLDLDVVLAELKRCRGTQFDPKLVDVMLELIDDGTIDVQKIYEDSRENRTANENAE